MNTILVSANLPWFLLCSYCIGWVLALRRAKEYEMLDLCQFIRGFIYSPFILICLAGCGILAFMFFAVVIHFISTILTVSALLILSCLGLGIVGNFIVVPTVKKAYGVARPFSSKICIVLYRKWR